MTAKADVRSSRVLEVFPYLCVRNASAAMDFYAAVFGAEEITRMEDGGRIVHAEMRLGPITLMLADELPEYGIVSPQSVGGTGTTLHLHVSDVDSMVAMAVARGAVVLRGPSDEPHGERQCRLRDPFGHEWLLGHDLRASP